MTASVRMCERHPAIQANLECEACGRPICPRCVADSARSMVCDDCYVPERPQPRIAVAPDRPSDRATSIRPRGLTVLGVVLIVNAVMIMTTALIGLLASVVGLDPGNFSSAAYAVGGIAWLGLGSLYLFVFWSLSGQTPGMRFLDIRIERGGERAIGPGHAFKRLVGFWLAAIPFCLGFLGVLLRLDRRGFHDRLGQTMVFYINPAGPNQPHLEAVVNPMEEESNEPVMPADPIPAEKPVSFPEGQPGEVG